MVYTLTVNPALDYVMHFDGIVPGEVNRSTGENLFFGGKGINVSAVLHTLGTDSVALGFIAGFTGDILLQKLKETGIRTDFIRLKTGMTRINVKLKSGTETDLNATGPDIDKEAEAALLQKIRCLCPADFFIISGNIPQTVPDGMFDRLMSTVAESGAHCVADVSGEALGSVLKYRPFLIKPNLSELCAVLGEKLSEKQQITDGARRLQERGAANVLVSLAGNGAVLSDENGMIHHIKAHTGTVKNSVGAGDSMVAGFLTEYLKSHDYANALRLANAAGGATAFSEGLAGRVLIEQLFHR